MTWFMAGAAAISAGTAIYSGISSRNQATRSANSVSKAEGEAIVKERLNRTVSNAYSTAFSQMQLALSKRQKSEQRASVSAAELATQSDVATLNAASASIGSSTAAVSADITQKADAARAQLDDAYEMDQVNYNNELDMMVLNTDQSAPNVRKNEYFGPSIGAIVGTSLVQGLTSFATSYGMRQSSLGLGTSANVPGTTRSNLGSQYALPTAGIRLGG